MSEIKYYPFSNGEAISIASLVLWLENQIKLSETNMNDADRQIHILLGPCASYDTLPESIPESHRQEIRFAQEEMIKSMGEMNVLNMLLKEIKR